MLNDQRHRTTAVAEHEDDPSDSAEFRDIHALTPTSHPSRGRRREQLWEGGSHRSSASLSAGSDAVSEGGFSTMSREFNAMVVAGSTLQNVDSGSADDGALQNQLLARIGEDELEETNPLAIVPDTNPIPSPRRPRPGGEPSAAAAANPADDVPVHLVKKEEVESKISAWQTAEVAKINNRFKREEVIINGWESEQVEKATAWLKKVERKLDEQRARAMEKMQNDVAKAHQKTSERRASAESKRGTKVAKVFELANFMRAVGRAPSKRSFF